MMFPHTMTLYHRTEQNGVTAWKRTVLNNVLWEDIEGVIMRKTGVKPQDKAQVYIPMRSNIAITEKDIIIKGECSTEISKSSKELPDGLYVTMVETYDYGGLQHWRVTAK